MSKVRFDITLGMRQLSFADCSTIFWTNPSPNFQLVGLTICISEFDFQRNPPFRADVVAP